MPDHFSQNESGNRDDDPWKQGGKQSPESNSGAHVGRQKLGDARCDVAQLLGGDPQVFGTDDTVDETNGKRETVRVFEHTS